MPDEQIDEAVETLAEILADEDSAEAYVAYDEELAKRAKLRKLNNDILKTMGF